MFTVKHYPEDVAESLCLIAFNNPSRRTIMECADGLLGLLATAKNHIIQKDTEYCTKCLKQL